MPHPAEPLTKEVDFFALIAIRNQKAFNSLNNQKGDKTDLIQEKRNKLIYFYNQKTDVQKKEALQMLKETLVAKKNDIEIGSAEISVFETIDELLNAVDGATIVKLYNQAFRVNARNQITGPKRATKAINAAALTLSNMVLAGLPFESACAIIEPTCSIKSIREAASNITSVSQEDLRAIGIL